MALSQPAIRRRSSTLSISHATIESKMFGGGVNYSTTIRRGGSLRCRVITRLEGLVQHIQ